MGSKLTDSEEYTLTGVRKIRYRIARLPDGQASTTIS